MSNVARIILALALFAVAAFCVFGFLASFEPGAPNPVLWRVVYGMFGAGATIAASWLLWLAWHAKTEWKG